MASVVLWHIHIGNEDFLIASQVSAIFNANQMAFFQKYPRLWKRLLSAEEKNQFLPLIPKQSMDKLREPIFLLKSQELLNKLKSIPSININIIDIQLKESIAVTSQEQAVQKVAKMDDPMSIEEADYVRMLNDQRDRIQSLLSEKTKGKAFDQKQQELLLSKRYSEPFHLSENPNLINHEKLLNHPLSNEPINNSQDVLVPIRLDIESESLKFKDTFTWNLQERQITPEMFAAILCEDYNLSPAQFAAPISKSIREQIIEFSNYLKGPQSNGSDLRILIKLDITVGKHTLIDQFEWDLNRYDRAIDPEWYASMLASELGLNGEFQTAIAHSIREQIYLHTKSLMIFGYNFDHPDPMVGIASLDDPELQDAFLPPVKHPYREHELQEYFTPVLMEISEQEAEKIETNRERDARRKRRLNRGRRVEVWALKSPPKTNRSLQIAKRGINAGKEIQPPPLVRHMFTPSSKGNTLSAPVDLPATLKSDATKIIPATSMDIGSSWKCENCKCLLDKTSLVRRGPSGEGTLCNQCGLYYSKHNIMRPLQ